jgi:hypothetical protein
MISIIISIVLRLKYELYNKENILLYLDKRMAEVSGWFMTKSDKIRQLSQEQMNAIEHLLLGKSDRAQQRRWV